MKLATQIKILTPNSKKLFDNPPVFNSEQRKKMFTIQKWVLKILETFPNSMSKAGFVLQLGYFRAVNKFYSSNKFHERDVQYVTNSLKLNPNRLSLSEYKGRTFLRHQEIILDKVGFEKFNQDIKSKLAAEADLLTSRQQKPRLVFMSLVDFLLTNKIQVPNYNTFADIITESLKNYENRLAQTINDQLSEEEMALMDSMLDKDATSGIDR